MELVELVNRRLWREEQLLVCLGDPDLSPSKPSPFTAPSPGPHLSLGLLGAAGMMFYGEERKQGCLTPAIRLLRPWPQIFPLIYFLFSSQAGCSVTISLVFVFFFRSCLLSIT